MLSRNVVVLALVAGVALVPIAGSAQGAAARGTGAAAVAQAPRLPERAVRRDLPLTNIIRRAYAAGTRDSTGRPGRNYWQLWNDYTINARLEPSTSTLTGRETIVIHNNSPDSLTQIALRLDQNIFRATAPRAAPTVPSEITEGMVITKISVNGQEVNLGGGGRGGRGGGGGGGGAGRAAGGGRGGAARGAGAGAAGAAAAADTPPPQAPQASASGLTSTSARVMLGSPLAPKGTATLEIEWNFKLAGGAGGSGHRMTARFADTLYQVTQWYPRVAVYDDLRGWDPDAYLGPSEFYNNFGRFDVSLDVPGGWLVGATGVLQNPQQVLTPVARERLSHVLESDSTRIIVTADEVGPGSATAAGDRLVWRFVADTVNDFAWGTAKKFVWAATRATIPTRGPIPVNMFYLPGRAAGFANTGVTLRHALEFYSKMWIPDPFPVHTLLDGPDTGMEYPMVVMSNEGAADHETGHMWWPMTVSNNETWYGFMDEGFNQYQNILSAADRRGEVPSLDGNGQSYGRNSGNEAQAPLMWDANFGSSGYSFQAYSKAPLMLSMLGGVVGDTAVWKAQSAFASAWRFKHPSPWDYAFFMSHALGGNLDWFWNYWLFTTESTDGSIQTVTTVGTRTTVVVRQDGQMPSPVVLRVQFAPTGPAIKPLTNSKMVDSLTADVTWPVDVWFAGSKTYTASMDFGRKIDRITLDPRGRFPDRDACDNVWPKPAPAVAGAAGAGAGGAAGRGARGGGGGGRGGRGGGCS